MFLLELIQNQNLIMIYYLILLSLINLTNCELELCEKSLDYLLNSKSSKFLSNSSTFKWNELNSLLPNDLNKCSIIGFDDKFNFKDHQIKFKILFCKIDYQVNQTNHLDMNNISIDNMEKRISIHFCLPNTCSKDDLNSIDEFYFKELLNDLIYSPNNELIDYLILQQFIQKNMKSNQMQCTSYDDNQTNWLKIDLIAFIIFVLFLTTLIITSTTIDCMNKSLDRVESVVLISQLEDESNNYQSINQQKQKDKFYKIDLKKFIDNFSILSSINRLIFVKNDVSINCIYGFKVLSIIWIIIGHTYIFSASIADNYLEFKQLIKFQFFSRLVLNCSFAVDTFFTLSGFLLSYLLFKRKLLKPNFWKINNLLAFYFNRYI